MSSRHRVARRSIASLALARAPLLYIPVAAIGPTSLSDPIAGEEIPRPDAAATAVACAGLKRRASAADAAVACRCGEAERD